METAQRGQVWYKDVVQTFYPKGSRPNLIRSVRPLTLCVRNSPTTTAESRGRFLPNMPPQSCYDWYVQGRWFRPGVWACSEPNKQIFRYVAAGWTVSFRHRYAIVDSAQGYLQRLLRWTPNIAPSLVRVWSKPPFFKITVNDETDFQSATIVTNAYCMRPYCVPDWSCSSLGLTVVFRISCRFSFCSQRNIWNVPNVKHKDLFFDLILNVCSVFLFFNSARKSYRSCKNMFLFLFKFV